MTANQAHTPAPREPVCDIFHDPIRVEQCCGSGADVPDWAPRTPLTTLRRMVPSGLSWPVLQFRHGDARDRACAPGDDPPATSGPHPPASEARRTWGGPGAGRACGGCERTITNDEMEFEVEFAPGGPASQVLRSESQVLYLQATCFAAWELERELWLRANPS